MTYQNHNSPRTQGSPNQRGPFQKRHGDGDSTATVESALQIKSIVSYFGEDNKLRPELLDDEAQKQARKLENITSTQMRRFYSQVVAIKRILDSDRENVVTNSEVVAQVAFLKASAAYAAAREKKNPDLVKFIVCHANSIKSREDFIAFQRHFETVVAFHKVFSTEKNNS